MTHKVTECLKMLSRDIRLINLASKKQAPQSEIVELQSVLNKMLELATSQIITEKSQVVYQEAHC
jgi:hypothetical protein